MDIEPDEIDTGYEGMTSDGGSGGAGGKSGRRGDGPSLFMKLELREKPYKVRLLCEPVMRRKHWDAFRPLKQYPLSPAEKVDQKDLDVAWSQGYWVPRRRFWAVVFDRENNSMIRVLESGPQVFDPIGSFYNMTKKNSTTGKGINPAGNKGPDWLIEVKLDESGKTQYVVMPDPSGPKPFTEDENKRMKATEVDRNWLLTKLCVKSTPEQIKELYAQLPEDKKKAPKRPKKGEEGKGGDQPSQPDSKAPEANQEAPDTAKDGFLNEDDENIPPPDDAGDEGGAEAGDGDSVALF